MKIAVLGAGVSGLSAARMLKDKGHEVVVYEKNSTTGGLARSRYVNGMLYDPHGGHILNSKHKEVMNWVFSIYPKENWKYTDRNAKIFFSGKYISYPFELSLCELDADDAVECVHDFVLSQNGPEPDNFKDWLTWNFGRSIANFYMIPYNEKIWAYPLEDMGTGWMRGKMPLPTKKEIIRSVILKDPKERKMPHASFYYPLHGGIQAMVNAIGEGLKIYTDFTIKTLNKVNGKWNVNGEGEYDRIISTIPLPELPKVMQLPEKVVYFIKGLKYNSLTTVLFECPKTDITWLYIPSHDYKCHRVGYQSALTPYANPDTTKGCGALEVIGTDFKVTEDIVDDNTLPEELGFNKILDHQFSEYAYVIHDKAYDINVNGIKDYFKGDPTFSLLGRWATWNYKNMDLCMLDAMELTKGL